MTASIDFIPPESKDKNCVPSYSFDESNDEFDRTFHTHTVSLFSQVEMTEGTFLEFAVYRTRASSSKLPAASMTTCKDELSK